MYPMFRFFLQAMSGRQAWKKIKKDTHLKEDGYLLLYAGEEDLFMQVMRYLPEFVQKKYASMAVVVVPEGMHVHVPKSDRKIQIASLPEKKLEALLRFYRLSSFFDHVIPISLNEPFGSYGLLKKHGIQLADLIRDYLMI